MIISENYIEFKGKCLNFNIKKSLAKEITTLYSNPL